MRLGYGLAGGRVCKLHGSSQPYCQLGTATNLDALYWDGTWEKPDAPMNTPKSSNSFNGKPELSSKVLLVDYRGFGWQLCSMDPLR